MRTPQLNALSDALQAAGIPASKYGDFAEYLNNSPELELFTEEKEQENLDKKLELLEEHAALEPAAREAYAAAEREIASALAAEDKIDRAMQAARQTTAAISAKHGSAQYVIHRRQFDIAHELDEMGDPRLSNTPLRVTQRRELEQLKSDLRGLVRVWPVRMRMVLGYQTGYSSNTAEIAAANAALDAEIAECKRLQRACVTRIDVSEALVAMNTRLEKPLAVLELNGPQLNRDFEIGPPLTWAGFACWSVDHLQERQLRASQLFQRDLEERLAAAPKK